LINLKSLNLVIIGNQYLKSGGMDFHLPKLSDSEIKNKS